LKILKTRKIGIENRNEQKEVNDTEEEKAKETDRIKDGDEVQTLRRFSTVSRLPTRYHDEYIYANYCSINVPNTYQEMLCRVMQGGWTIAGSYGQRDQGYKWKQYLGTGRQTWKRSTGCKMNIF